MKPCLALSEAKVACYDNRSEEYEDKENRMRGWGVTGGSEELPAMLTSAQRTEEHREGRNR